MIDELGQARELVARCLGLVGLEALDSVFGQPQRRLQLSGALQGDELALLQLALADSQPLGLLAANSADQIDELGPAQTADPVR